ncbi:ribosomal-protein-alanine N-acetyltransferase [Halalkalibacillus sediminis]|uniref:[Ribosomal protein bS18]-alanine N-acetyltransferase n=2 Tax=Halalkalibacillus sediminis TaxID=2018042 RepID=A0A2I0QQC8_9BACI|nr:ribosomal-protein-alanine N-acetyltransferase [Halalkalibacillus sediminis]
MTVEDLDEIFEIETASFRSPWKKKDFFFDLTENLFSHYLVLEKEGRLIGYCGVWIVLESAQITNIAILPEERGHNYGEFLFDKVLELSKREGATELTLEVRESNLVAQNLYEKLGLKIVGRREKYYKNDGEDALVMWVKL